MACIVYTWWEWKLWHFGQCILIAQHLIKTTFCTKLRCSMCVERVFLCTCSIHGDKCENYIARLCETRWSVKETILYGKMSGNLKLFEYMRVQCTSLQLVATTYITNFRLTFRTNGSRKVERSVCGEFVWCSLLAHFFFISFTKRRLFAQKTRRNFKLCRQHK